MIKYQKSKGNQKAQTILQRVEIVCNKDKITYISGGI